MKTMSLGFLIDKLKAPTDKRAVDAGNPPKEIEVIINKMIALSNKEQR